MEVVLRFLEKIEIWIYLVGGVLVILFLTRLITAWQEGRTAIFGLERDSAQRRFSLAMTLLIVVLIFVMTEFILVSFVSPALPQTGLLRTPTLDLLSTPTVTLPPGAESTPGDSQPTAITLNLLATLPAESCTPGQIEWISPKSGESISGTVTLKGTVNVNAFGFYKYEYSQPSTEVWTTIAAGTQVVQNGDLGVWNTSQMLPGDYLLRLVVVDNQNNSLPPCVIPIRILTSTE